MAMSQSWARVPWSLYLRVRILRFLQQIGAWLHTNPRPTPVNPTFVRQIPAGGRDSTASNERIDLYFYVPDTYAQETSKGKKYPAVLNFHGGGFTLGSAKDDGRWATAVRANTDAIVVSVNYRLGPEHPFPAAVDDCAEAFLHLTQYADTYGIDAKKIALSGFSAGGNLVFALLLRLQLLLGTTPETTHGTAFGGSSSPRPEPPQVVAVISWYPLLDQRISRAKRRATCVRPDKTLPPILTRVFDEAYVPPSVDKSEPLLSPAAASDKDLFTALPNKIVMYLCEWDMLYKEGQDFVQRLQKLGKKVSCTQIAETQHAFDKSPNPFRVDPKVDSLYREACQHLKEAFSD